MVWGLLALLVAFCSYFAMLSWWSRTVPALGLVEGRLQPCPHTANCVSSEASDANLEPFRYNGDPKRAWTRSLAAVTALGGRLIETGDGYARAEFRSRVFRFVDDLELRLDTAHHCVQVRSASRVGHSDLGANRARVARLRARLESSKP
jgi:uncharacterized protein (DUF1499 family)